MQQSVVENGIVLSDENQRQRMAAATCRRSHVRRSPLALSSAASKIVHVGPLSVSKWFDIAKPPSAAYTILTMPAILEKPEGVTVSGKQRRTLQIAAELRAECNTHTEKQRWEGYQRFIERVKRARNGHAIVEF